MDKTKYLIIGNSVAGVFCIEGIRSVDKKGSITVISDENIFNYSKPLISYYLGNRIKENQIHFRSKSFYERNKVNLILNTHAFKIDEERKEVHTNKGKIKFEKLLIATGGSPIIPPIKGLEKTKSGIFTFTRFKDAKNLINYIKKEKIKKAVVLGGGLIGLKCTEGLIERDIEVNVVELAPKILANTFDMVASEIIENSLKKMKCNFIKENTIEEIISEKGKIKEVKLKSAEKIQTKLLIIAIGVRPDLSIVKDTKIKVNRGIVVNKFMETNIKDIFSAGDISESKDFLTGKNSVIAIWPVAARTGKIAGYNMAGEKKEYEGPFIMNSVELAGIPTISFGITNLESDEYEILSTERKRENYYRKIVLRNNRVVGGIFVGKIERAGIFTGLIRHKVNCAKFKKFLLRDDFGFLLLPEEFRKHMVVGEGIEV